MRILQEGHIVLSPKPPTIVELALALDISKFMKAARPEPTEAALSRSMARVQAAMDDSQASMAYFEQVAKETAAVTGADLYEIKEILERFRVNPWGQFGETPDQELNRRLNMRMQGVDPGPPINWKGITVKIHPKPWWQR